MAKVEGFDFFPLTFDGDGNLEKKPELDAIAAHIASAGTTDFISIAHGFRNDEQEATALYTEFLKNLRAHLTRGELASLAGRKFVVAGVFWPSKSFPEGPSAGDGGVQSAGTSSAAKERAALEKQLKAWVDDDSTPAQKKAVAKVLRLLDDANTDPDVQDEIVATLLSMAGKVPKTDDDGLSVIRSTPGREVLESLKTPIRLKVAKRRKTDEGGVTSVRGGGSGAAGAGGVMSIGGAFKSAFGRIGQVLNMTTWYQMKSRSGTVGADGLAPAIRAIKKKAPALRVHIVGHSLGGRLAAACAKALSAAPKLQADSLTLLEAAFSHYGFSDNNGDGTPGFFREVIAQQVVKGPCVSTFSVQDTVVGRVYAIASRLADDNTKAVGDENDKYGGIGRNGTQRTTEATRDVLHKAGTAYSPFKAGVVHNLDGSGGLIKDHGDVRNPDVTYAFASVLHQTV